MGALLLFAFVSIGFSFLCSIWEAVLLSIPTSYVHSKVKDGTQTGLLLQRFKEKVDRPLTAILTLNTIAHTVGAILVGASTGAAFGEGGFELLGFEVSYEVVVSVVMTIAILVLSEIIPKTLGATYWKALAPFTVKSLNILVLFFKYTGVIWLMEQITNLLKGGDLHGSTLSRSEFTVMAEVSEQEGIIKAEEGRILRNLLAFSSLTVHDVMTPRTVVVGAWARLTIKEFYEKFDASPFSRFPIYKENRDQVLGYVLKDEVYKAMLHQRDNEPIGELVREILLVPQVTTLHKAIDLLLERREPIALVVDEFGGFEGLVTMEDVMETLLGLEIMDESDATSDMQDLARERWRRRAEAMGIDVSELNPQPEGEETIGSVNQDKVVTGITGGEIGQQTENK